MTHIFISYSSSDIIFVRYFKGLLENEGFLVWIDEAEIVSGDRWWPTIERQIEACAAFLVIMSPDSKSSEWVEREILKAQKEKRPIYPILLNGEPWDMLANRQYVNMTHGLAAPSPQKLVGALRRDVNQQKEPLRRSGHLAEPDNPKENALHMDMSDDLVIGNLSVPVKVLIGDSHTTFGKTDVAVEYNSRWDDNIPQEWRNIMPEVIRRFEENARKSGQVLFDGPGYFLRDYTFDVVNPYDEVFRLNLLMGPSSYYRYIGSNKALYQQFLQSGEGLISLAEKYPLSAMDLSELPLSNYLAVNVNLITSDRQFLVQRRSRRVSNFQGSLASAINASMSRGTKGRTMDEDERGRPDPFITVLREAKEELGINLFVEDIKFFGLIIELEYYQTLLFGEVYTALSSTEILRKARLAAKDKFEYARLEFYPFTLQGVATRLLDPSSPWVPVSALAVIFSTMHAFGEDELEQSLSGSGEVRRLGGGS
jgi:hypothetical protein